MFDDAQKADIEGFEITAAMHGVKLDGKKSGKKGRGKSAGNSLNEPIFGDPDDDKHLSAEEREKKTQEQMAAFMKLPFASKVNGLKDYQVKK